MTRTSFTTTSRKPEQIARRGQSICPMDETIPPVIAAVHCAVTPKRRTRKPLGEESIGAFLSRKTGIAMVPTVGANGPTLIPVTESGPISNAVEIIVHAIRSKKVELLSLEARLNMGYILGRSELWQGLTVGRKAVIADLLTDEWLVDPEYYWIYAFPSMTRDGLWHQLEFNPLTGEMECSCEASQKKTGECFHMRLFAMRYRAVVMMQYEASPTREEESIYRADAESETGRLGMTERERIAANSKKLINAERDF